MPTAYDDVGECVEATLRRVGRRVVLAVPIGIGKPVPVVDEFWRRALRDPGLDLTIVTALTLRRPAARSELERRYAGPLLERVFGDYREPEYAAAMRAGAVPPNVRVIEFYLEPGAALDVEHSQQHYLSANYTQVARDLAARGVNVVAQLVARRTVGGETRYSLGANPDVTLDLLPRLAAARRAGREIVVMASVHGELPYMYGSAELPADAFDAVLDDPRDDGVLFGPPNAPLSRGDHSIALHVSALVRDGGTLQIGIGELGDALCYALLLRHQQNGAWAQALRDVGTERNVPGLVDAEGGREAFHEGLFASTEMFVDQMLELHRAGILRRRVYDSLPLSRLIASGQAAERFDARILGDLPHVGVGPRLDAAQFVHLRHFGVFRQDCEWRDGRIRSPEGEWIEADLADPRAVAALAASCLGRELRNGHVLHAGFFLGPRGFYAALRGMPERELRQFDMRGISRINQLHGADAELRVLQRRDARFVNTTMMSTLLGAAISDTLEDGRVVSGVGGQHDFVAMAHALPGARSILCLRATRTKGGQTRSNLVWSYGNTTIPRHLRDIVVTEYGIADLRGRTDAECVAALLNVADSRFQPELLAAAKAARKLPRDHRVPEAFRQNFPARLDRALASHRRAGLFTELPFGTDLTAEEVALGRALRHLREATATPWGRIRTVAAASLERGRGRADDLAALRRMALDRPANARERLLARLVAWALHRTQPAADGSGAPAH
ncbi:MAG: acetyl-CoA hydrolase [Steroidobacteraceae bacterium]|nr:acetyl-CoA hydrolase [Steroidobacteraceae bacterium]